ncbi:YqeB family protein [Leucobacter sp. M11]|uniref:YqeB family protein n=1 Tax=Leucobacter sp. M11 TaxID=2993565 RepID=UPI002D7E803D|nr:hypothetical protein [Leucobacter sp. M11]MEB4613664.1 hypothetical protein [Leucobacter sp. M11]
MTKGTRVLAWSVLGGVGVGLGFLVPWLLRGAAAWSLPAAEALRWLGSGDAPLVVFGRPAVLGLVGPLIAFLVTQGSAEVAVSAERIRIRAGGDARVLERARVGAVRRLGGRQRIESPEGRVLFDGDVEGGRRVVAGAFVRHGYPWAGGRRRPRVAGRRARS